MPAAQGRAPFLAFRPYRFDTTELPCTDDLYRPHGAIAQAERLAAQSADAAATLMLHDGSTAGVQVMLLYACGHGGQVVLPRNAHLSCLNLCAAAGIEPVFAEPSFTAEGRPYTTPEAYAAALDSAPRAQAFALRSDYYGLLDDLSGIAREAHRRGRLLLCDEAHGAYFNWRKDIPNAGACGADLFVQSAHKTLPALTPGAWLHAMQSVDALRLRDILRMVQTSSPSFLLMQSLDDARAWMDLRGESACERLATAMERFYHEAAKLGFPNGQPQPPDPLRYDRLRLVLDAPMGGEELGRQLARRGLDVELTDPGHIVCILSLIDGPARLRRLLRALRSIARDGGLASPAEAPDAAPSASPAATGSTGALTPAQWPPRRMPLSRAAFAASEALPVGEAAGRVSAVSAGRYPPGVAWLTSGDEITPEIAGLLAHTPPSLLFGLDADHRLRCVRPEAVSRS